MMKRIALIAALLSTAAFAGEALFDALAQRPAGEGTVIVPDSHLRRWDPITVFFAQEVAQPGAEAQPQRFMRLRPDQPGAYEWLDAKTLQFRPAQPWTPLSRVEVEAGDAEARLATLLQAPINAQPSEGAVSKKPVSRITLTFRGDTTPTPTAALAEVLEIKVDALATDAQRTLTAEDFTVKRLQRSGPDEPLKYALLLRSPIPLGQRVSLRLGLSLDERREVAYRLNFETAKPFEVKQLSCTYGAGVALAGGATLSKSRPLDCEKPAVRLGFTASLKGEVDPIMARNLIRFEPSVDKLAWDVIDSRLEVRGDFERDQLYQVRVMPTPILDQDGRALSLEAPITAWVRFPAPKASLVWGDGAGILELRGPKHLPIVGQGVLRADMRVYRVDPFSRDLWPLEGVARVDETVQPPTPGYRPEPWAEARNIPKDQLIQRLRALGTPSLSTLVELPLEATAGRAGLDLAPHLKKIEGRLTPGHYLVGLRGLESTQRDWRRIQVTDLSLATVEARDATRFVVTRLSDGAPVEGATVRVEGRVGFSWKSRYWGTIFEGKTGKDGMVEWAAPGDAQGEGRLVYRISAQKDRDALVLDPDEPPDYFKDGHWRGQTWRDWLAWAVDDLQYREARPETLAHLFTERPIYRPEHDVHIGGWVRTRFQGKYEAITGPALLQIIDPEGEAETLPVTLDEDGAFYYKWSRDGAATGLYRAQLRGMDKSYITSQTFRVEAYRLPRFKVDLIGPKRAPSDRPFDVSLQASYFAGGKVVGRPLRWRVTQFPYRWTPKARPGFLYSSDGRYSRVRRFEASPEGVFLEKTGAEGQARLTLDPTLEPNAQPRTYVVEATVTGADEQTVTTTHRVHATPAFALGLKVARFLPEAKVIEPEIIVVNGAGDLIAGQKLEVRLLRRQWHAHLQASDFSTGDARYITEMVDEEILKRAVTSGKAPLKLSLPIDQAGVYVVEISGADKLGRAQSVVVDLYAGGEGAKGAVGWRKPEAGVFKLTADAKKYAPGATANLVVQSPFQEAEALVIIEAPEGNQYHWRPVRKGQATFTLPIQREWMPKVPVHVALMRGRVAAPDRQSKTDPGRPKTLASTLWLDVEPVGHQVKVDLKHPEESTPGQSFDVQINLKDHAGQPIAGKVTLWLVDAAILTLADEQPLDPLKDFITSPSSYVELRDTRNLVLGRIPFSEMPGGDGGDADEMAGFDKLTVRKDFKPVPYFAHALEVGKAGRTVKITLPDNLTRFAVRAKAISGVERFGAAKSHIDVRLPVLVQPALPRFVRPGDQLVAAAVGRVVSGEGGPAVAQIELVGAVARGEAVTHLNLPKAAPARVEFPLDVPEAFGKAVEVKVGLIRQADGVGDAFKVKLPIRDDQRWLSARALFDVNDQPRAVPLPTPKARPGSVQRRIVFNQRGEALAALAGLDFLRHAPAYNTEQIISRARVYLALREVNALIQKDAHIQFDAAIKAALDWLPLVTNDAGRVAYWPGGGGSVALTAYALEFITEARRAGVTVPADLPKPMIRALRQALRSDYGFFVKGAEWYERAIALAGLASAGQLSEAYFSELSDKARFLGLGGVAALINAAVDSGRQADPMVARLVERLLEGVKLRKHEGRLIYAGLDDVGAFSAAVLHCEALVLAEATRALLRVGADERAPEKVEAMVEALVRLGLGDGWGASYTNAAAIRALSERLNRGGGAVKVEIFEQGFDRALALGPQAPTAGELTDRLTPIQVKADGQARALAGLSWVPSGSASAHAPETYGLIVERDLLIIRDGKEIARARVNQPNLQVNLKVGDVVETHVRLVNPKDRHFVALEAPLAAGMEPLNPELATAPAEAKPSHADTRSADYTARLDDRVFWAFEALPKGSYDFYFRAKATFEGRFVQPPAWSEALYTPSQRGRSSGAVVTIRR